MRLVVLVFIAFLGGVNLRKAPDICLSLFNRTKTSVPSNAEHTRESFKVKRSVAHQLEEEIDSGADVGYTDHESHHSRRHHTHRLRRHGHDFTGTVVSDLRLFHFDFFVHVETKVLESNGEENVKYCGGALLTTFWFITARECVVDPDGHIYSGNITMIAAIANRHNKTKENTFEVEYVDDFPQNPPGRVILLIVKHTTRYLGIKPISVQEEDVLDPTVCFIGREAAHDHLRAFSKKSRNERDLGRIQSENHGLCESDLGYPVISFDSEKKKFLLEGIVVSTECSSNGTRTTTFDRITPHLDHLRSISSFLVSEKKESDEFALPYDVELRKGIHIGQSLILEGRFHDNASWFQIEFRSVLHRNSAVPMGSKYNVKINFSNLKMTSSHMNYTWSYDQKVTSSPYVKGDYFFLRLIIFNNKIEIRTNDSLALVNSLPSDFLHFEHLKIDGNATITHLHMGGSLHQNKKTLLSSTHSRFPVNGFLEFYIIPEGDWRINLYGEGNETDILFHASIRFGEKSPNGTDGVIVRNLMDDATGKFGEEEREGSFPFVKNVGSTVRITNTWDHIEFRVNDILLFTFKHRLSYGCEFYKFFQFEGDAIVMDLKRGKPKKPRYRRHHHRRHHKHHHHRKQLF